MNKYHLLFTLSVTVAGTGLLLLYVHNRRVKNRTKNRAKNMEPFDDNWEIVGTVEKIIIYPIKSGAGSELFEANCGRNGLESNGFPDRFLILFDDNDNVVFAGHHPKMLQIESDIFYEDSLLVLAPSMEPLFLSITEMIKDQKEVYKCIEGVIVPVIECDEVYAGWFSTFLLGKETGIRLFIRVPQKREKKLPVTNKSLNPYMVITDESVANLNARLINKVDHRQFRANILIDTHLPAFAEDNWKWMRIGDRATFRYKAPCYRCILPNINPFTLERSRDFEPLRTLKSFRMRPGQKEPEMGIYFDLHKEGDIKWGDPVYVIT